MSLIAIPGFPRADSRSRPLCCPHVLGFLQKSNRILMFPSVSAWDPLSIELTLRSNAPNFLSLQRGNAEGTTLGNPCTELVRTESRGEALGSTLLGCGVPSN